MANVERGDPKVLSRGDYEEKRDHRRMGIDSPMRFTVVDTGEVHDGIARDLSANGMLIECGVPIAVGAMLEINVTPERTVVAPLEAVAEVVRVESAGPDRFNVGVAIRSYRR